MDKRAEAREPCDPGRVDRMGVRRQGETARLRRVGWGCGEYGHFVSLVLGQVKSCREDPCGARSTSLNVGVEVTAGEGEKRWFGRRRSPLPKDHLSGDLVETMGWMSTPSC